MDNRTKALTTGSALIVLIVALAMIPFYAWMAGIAIEAITQHSVTRGGALAVILVGKYLFDFSPPKLKRDD